MSRRCRSLSTILSAVFLVALSGMLTGCGGDHSSGGGASATSSGKGGANSDGGDISSSYLATGEDLTGDYTVTTDDGGNNDGSNDGSDGGTTDLVVADNGDVSGTAPDSDGNSGDLSGIVDSGGDTDVTSTSVSRTVHIVGKLKRTAPGVLVGAMTETITKNGAAPVTRIVVYRLTRKTGRIANVASR